MWSGSDSDLVCQSNIKRLNCVSKYFHFWAALHLEQDHILFHRSTIITMTKRWMFITNDWYISFRHELPIPCALQIWDTSGKRNYLYVSSTERVSEITKFPLTALVIPTIWSAVKTRKSKRQIRTEWLRRCEWRLIRQAGNPNSMMRLVESDQVSTTHPHSVHSAHSEHQPTKYHHDKCQAKANMSGNISLRWIKCKYFVV